MTFPTGRFPFASATSESSAISKLIPIAAVFAGIVLAAIVGPPSVDELRIVADFDRFVPVEAEVSGNRTQQHRKGPATQAVEFTFQTADGTTIQGDNYLTRATDSPDLVAGLIHRERGIERLTVYYDPDNPRRAVIHEVSALPPALLLIVSTLLAVGGTHATLIDRRRRRLQQRAIEARRERG